MVEQEKREIFINAIEKCALMRNGSIDHVGTCPACVHAACMYGREDGAPCESSPLLLDYIVALLKAQEPVSPTMHYIPDGKRISAIWQCGNCLIDIGYGVNYCYNCGRPVNWSG